MKFKKNQLAATLFLTLVLAFSSLLATIPQVQATDLETHTKTYVAIKPNYLFLFLFF